MSDPWSKVQPGQDWLTCAGCGEVRPVLKKSGQHIRGDCPSCARFLKFLRRKDKPLLAIVLKMLSRLSEREQRELLRVLDSMPAGRRNG